MRITLKVIDIKPNELWDKIFDLNHAFFKTKDSYVFPNGSIALYNQLTDLKQEYYLKNKTLIITKD